MKRFVVAAALCLCVLPGTARSQVLIGILLGDKVTTEDFHLGLEIGGAITTYSGIDGAKARGGFNLGLIGEWRFAEGFYLQPAILPFYKAGAKSMPLKDVGVPEVDSLITDKSADRRTNYFAVPIILKYGFLEEKLHLGAGPQVNFLLSANDYYRGVITNEITVKEDVSDLLNARDAGIAFHAEYKFGGRYGTSFTARYYMGLTDTIKDNQGNEAKNHIVSLLLTVPIGGDPTQKDGSEGSDAEAGQEGP